MPIGVVNQLTKSIAVVAVVVAMSVVVKWHDSDSLAHVPSMNAVTRRTGGMNRGDRFDAIPVWPHIHPTHTLQCVVH